MQQIFTIFSKPIYLNTINYNLEKIIPNINKLQFNKANNRPDNTQASSNKNVLELNEFKDLKEDIMKYVYDYTHNLLKYTYNDFYITRSWFTKSVKGEYANLHNHNNCLFSGVLYIQTDENTGGIVFSDMTNDRLELEASEYNILNSKSHTIIPKAGLLIIFPSETYHKILENNSDLTRISLAFNVFPTGGIGIETSDSFLYLNK
jgi:uncharacterized protein (TIGR02466 family)